MTWGSQRLRHLSNIRVSNVDKKSVDGERRVRLCNYTDVYYNDRITTALDFMTATASSLQATNFQLQQGDTLITKDSETAEDIGVAAYVDEPLPGVLCGYHLALIRPLPTVDPRFLNWALRSEFVREQWAVSASGVTRFGLTYGAIKDAAVPLPPLDVQRRIANFLDNQVHRLDNALAFRIGQHELLMERVRQTIRLGVAGAITGGKPSGVPWVPALGEGAELRSLARTVTLQRGVDLTAEERSCGDVSVVTSGGVVGTHSKYVVEASGVVVGRYGTGGSVFWIDGPHWPHNTTLYVRDYHGNLKRWVYYLLKAFPFEMLQARAAVPGINRNEMAGVQMPWLPLERQSDAVSSIDAVLDRLARLSDAVARQGSLLNERKKSLITAAVTGAFDVSSASPRAADMALPGVGGGL